MNHPLTLTSKHGIMGVVPHGAQVVVVDYENGWYRVNYNEDYGCIKAELLQ